MTEADAIASQGFAHLRVTNWRQFGEIDIEFHPRLTVLTGANASGKTTLLNVLGRHFNWQSQLLGVPARTSVGWEVDQRQGHGGTSTIGQLRYTNGAEASLVITPSGVAEYPLTIQGQQTVPGVFISSHRNLSRYQRLETIPSQFSASEVVFAQFFQEILNKFLGSYTVKSPLTAMKEALIAAALFGHGTDAVEANEEARAVWEDFQRVLSIVLPSTFEFERLVVRSPEVILVTGQGEFLIDAVSGGISSIMELSWQLLLRSRQTAAFTACMDEPENHLHPSLQRSLIPSLLRAFPSITFVVASHSPFIVTSVRESHVYVLTGEEEGSEVTSRLLDQANKAASAEQTLREVLGMPTTNPMWVEGVLEDAMSSLEQDGPTAANLRKLQLAMREAGLQEQFPAAINALTEPADA